ncbi:hypothetical protein [Rhodalgimonas zhirmunskyi]|uniref:Uncharacterized protein n=1 Tax=Rhodalgimonas zhirmunskyi TaxID=2964767 RepID=A0AAJ1X4V9_9RHOB|nr:hypothetical protein [Rhodoalgimonas zhirmunskyi]MDQ2093921.1 hypothetical protein [Rhodoalgimonas zhirmunskyi]
MFESRTFWITDPPPEIFALTPADGFAPLLTLLAVVLIRQREAPARLWLLLALPMLLGFALGLDTSMLPADGQTPQDIPPEMAKSLSTGFVGFSGMILLGGAGVLALQAALGALFYPQLVRMLSLPVVALPLAWTLQKLSAGSAAAPTPLATSVGSVLSLALAFSLAMLAGQFLVSLLRRAGGPAGEGD